MAKRRDHRNPWLDDTGGEPLEESGFEGDTPDPAYWEDSDGEALPSGKPEVRHDVH